MCGNSYIGADLNGLSGQADTPRKAREIMRSGQMRYRVRQMDKQGQEGTIPAGLWAGGIKPPACHRRREVLPPKPQHRPLQSGWTHQIWLAASGHL